MGWVNRQASKQVSVSPKAIRLDPMLMSPPLFAQLGIHAVRAWRWGDGSLDAWEWGKYSSLGFGPGSRSPAPHNTVYR